MAVKTYRAAIIGHTGHGDYGHGLDTVYHGMDNVALVAVADPDPKGRAECAARTGAREQFAEYREMLTRTRPDLVSVAPRWIGGHRDMVLACAAAGVKGIYCEKPFARTLAEADEMLAACKQAGTRIAVAHQNRTVPYLDRVRELIRSGVIGKLTRIRGKGKDDPRGGAVDLVVLGTHVLDMMRAVAGNPLWAFGHLRQGDRDVMREDVKEGAEEVGALAGNNLTGYYAFPAGVAGTFESYVSSGSGRHLGLWLEGTEGTIALHGGFVKQAWICRTPQWTPELGAASWERIRIPEWDEDPTGRSRTGSEFLQLANQAMVRGLIRGVEEGAPHPSSGEDARWAMEMYFALPESQRTGERVPFPLRNRENPWTML